MSPLRDSSRNSQGKLKPVLFQPNPPLNVPLFPHAPEIPAETRQTPAENWGRGPWSRPWSGPWSGPWGGPWGGRLAPGETLREAREGLRRLLLGEAWGKLAKWRELPAKWRELAAKLGTKWRVWW